MKVVIGLGNPGDKYVGTRHNLGFEVMDELGKKIGGEDGEWKLDKKFKAAILKINSLFLIKPQTFMNNSGMTVKLLVDYYKIPLKDIIVIHDDLDLPVGKIKVRLGGSAAGHHGVESIINSLGDDKFIRVRLGIGSGEGLSLTKMSEHGKSHLGIERFVLEEFTNTEKPKVKQIIKHAVEAIRVLLNEGLEVAQNQYN